MTTLSNKDKTVKISFGNSVRQSEICVKERVYTVTLPEVTCNSEADAKFIQTKVNQFLNTLVRNLLKDKE